MSPPPGHRSTVFITPNSENEVREAEGEEEEDKVRGEIQEKGNANGT